MKCKEVFERVEKIVLTDRAEEYNNISKTEQHIQIAQVWSGIIGHEITAHQVALCMAGTKLVRAAFQPGHEDSYIDAAGYAAIAAEIMHEEPRDLHPSYGAHNIKSFDELRGE